MFIIGICGASGSGKSTLARSIQSKLNVPCIYIQQDAYYRDHPEMSFEERANINYDEPEAFEHDALYNDLLSLKKGEAITTKNYDYIQHRRCDSGDLIQPQEVVIVEGIHTFYDEKVRDMMDFRIYVQVDPDVCLLRRVKRDIRDRGRSIESIYKQYLETVKPMYERYIRQYADYADVIVPRGGKNARITDILVTFINS